MSHRIVVPASVMPDVKQRDDSRRHDLAAAAPDQELGLHSVGMRGRCSEPAGRYLASGSCGRSLRRILSQPSECAHRDEPELA